MMLNTINVIENDAILLIEMMFYKCGKYSNCELIMQHFINNIRRRMALR